MGIITAHSIQGKAEIVSLIYDGYILDCIFCILYSIIYDLLLFFICISLAAVIIKMKPP